MYTIGEFAKRVGVTVHTLQRWDREGRLKARRAVNNRRYYTDNDLAIALGQQKLETKEAVCCLLSGIWPRAKTRPCQPTSDA